MNAGMAVSTTPVKPTGPPDKKQPVKPTGPAKPVEPEPEAPSFTLAGIFKMGGLTTALLMTESGPVEAHVGQSVGGYKVTSINEATRQVVVEVKNHAFRVSLPKDSPYGTSGAGGSKSGGAPPPKGDAGAPAGGSGSGPLPPPPPPAKGGR